MPPSVSAASVILVPCNGHTLRGQLTQRVAQLLREQIDDIDIIDLVPLMAELPHALQLARQAKSLIGLAGCHHRCERSACQQFLKRSLDQEILLEHFIEPSCKELQDISEEDFQTWVLHITSSVLGQLTAL
ncbi:putative zinc-binding protein [Myxococcota bacterium]|nr:putative zinc-binding protein [Myxococcota bacterium]